MRVHRGKALIAGVAAITLALTACSSSKSSGGGSNNTDGNSANTSVTAGTKGTGNMANCATSPLTCNSGKTKQGGTFTYAIEKTIPGWNQLFADSNQFETAEIEDGFLPFVFQSTSDLKPTLNKDLMVSAEQTSASPQTLVYKISPNAIWDDGTPVSFDDFKYIKDTNDGTTCPKCGAASTAGYSSIDTMTGSDGGKTVTVVMKTPYADWQSMFGPLLPAHIASQHGSLTTADGLNATFQWFDKNVPNYSAGPFKVSAYSKDQSVTEVPNPKWYGATKPSLDSVIFRIITDQTQEPTAMQNNEIQGMYPQPNQDLVSQVNQIPNTSTYLGKGLTWEHLDFNEKNKFFADPVLRTAIFTAIDRKSIIARTVGTFVPNVAPLNNHIYVPGQAGYTDNVTASAQGSGDLAKAKSLLTAAGYTGVGTALKTKTGDPVSFRMTYSQGNTNRQQIAEIVQSTAKSLGITVTLKPVTDLADLGTGNYDMIVFAWVGAPFVVAGAQQIYELKGGADYGSNNDPQVEALINEAAQSTDPANVQKLMNQADVLLTKDAYELPLFQKPTFTAVSNTFVNIRDNATNQGPPVNMQEWGQKAS